MAGYVRQSSAEIQTGQVVLAAPINAEYNAIQAAFNATTGHTHDGSTANGPKISLTASVSGTLPIANGGTGATTAAGALTNLLGLGVTVDNTVPRFDGIAGALQTSGVVISDTNAVSGIVGLTVTGGGSLTGTWTSLGTVTTVDINGGTLDGVVIGGASAAAGTFTTGTFSGAITTTDQINFDSILSSSDITCIVATTGSGTVYLRPSGSGSTTGEVRVTGSDTTFTTTVFGTALDMSGTITGAGLITNANFSRETAGTLNFRPNGNASTTGQATLTTGGLFTATSFSGTGTSLTALDASNLTTGTVPDARITGAYSGITTLRVGDGSAAVPSFSFTADTNTGMWRSTTDTLNFSTAGVERMEIDATSVNIVPDVFISGDLDVFGSGIANNFISDSGVYSKTTAGTIVFRPNTAGSATNQATYTTTGVFTCVSLTETSDARKKTDITTVTDAMKTIKRLRGVTFKNDNGKKGLGVVAQEIQEVLPEIVHTDEQGYLSVAYTNLVGVLIEAVKELSARVEELEKV